MAELERFVLILVIIDFGKLYFKNEYAIDFKVNFSRIATANNAPEIFSEIEIHIFLGSIIFSFLYSIFNFPSDNDFIFKSALFCP